LLLAALSILIAGLALSIVAFTAGVQLAGLGVVVLAAWLVRYDTARRSLRRGGLARFTAVALLLGYIWLLLAGFLWLLGPNQVFDGFWYDAMLHTVFVGFALSMVFGHAPTIVPAIAGVFIPFQGRFYLHVGLLHVSLLLRIIGDVTTQMDLRRWGGLLNVTAILLFMGITVVAARSSHATGRGSFG
jgi:hypothetical protein